MKTRIYCTVDENGTPNAFYDYKPENGIEFIRVDCIDKLPRYLSMEDNYVKSVVKNFMKNPMHEQDSLEKKLYTMYRKGEARVLQFIGKRDRLNEANPPIYQVQVSTTADQILSLQIFDSAEDAAEYAKKKADNLKNDGESLRVSVYELEASEDHIFRARTQMCLYDVEQN